MSHTLTPSSWPYRVRIKGHRWCSIICQPGRKKVLEVLSCKEENGGREEVLPVLYEGFAKLTSCWSDVGKSGRRGNISSPPVPSLQTPRSHIDPHWRKREPAPCPTHCARTRAGIWRRLELHGHPLHLQPTRHSRTQHFCINSVYPQAQV